MPLAIEVSAISCATTWMMKRLLALSLGESDYAHSASAFALDPGARARREEIAGGLIFLSLQAR
jgi:hypothetical protein